MLKDISKYNFYGRSQFVRLRGKYTAQCTHCALVGPHSVDHRLVGGGGGRALDGALLSGDDEELQTHQTASQRFSTLRGLLPRGGDGCSSETTVSLGLCMPPDEMGTRLSETRRWRRGW